MSLVYPMMPESGEVRRRWSPSEAEKHMLEMSYNKDAFPSAVMRAELARCLSIEPRQVQVWFQNRRQKERAKTNNQEKQSPKPDKSVADILRPSNSASKGIGMQMPPPPAPQSPPSLLSSVGVGHMSEVLRSPTLPATMPPPPAPPPPPMSGAFEPLPTGAMADLLHRAGLGGFGGMGDGAVGLALRQMRQLMFSSQSLRLGSPLKSTLAAGAAANGNLGAASTAPGYSWLDQLKPAHQHHQFTAPLPPLSRGINKPQGWKRRVGVGVVRCRPLATLPPLTSSQSLTPCASKSLQSALLPMLTYASRLSRSPQPMDRRSISMDALEVLSTQFAPA